MAYSNIPTPKGIGFRHLLSHFHRTIDTREGHDVTLLFAGEVTRMLATFLEYLGNGMNLSDRKTTTAFGTRFVEAWACTRSLAAISGRAASRMQILSDFIEEWATLNRLWGLLDVWMFARKLYAQALANEDGFESISIVDTVIEASKILSLGAFHICEAGAVLASKKVLVLSVKTRERLQLVAIRSWAVFTFLELGRLLLQKSRLSRNQVPGASPDWFKQWKKEFFANLAWAPVTVHAGTVNSILPQLVINILGVYATASLFRDRWIETARQDEEYIVTTQG